MLHEKFDALRRVGEWFAADKYLLDEIQSLKLSRKAHMPPKRKCTIDQDAARRDCARRAQQIVFNAALPAKPGEKIGTQVKRAMRRLRADEMISGEARVQEAWRGRAGRPTLEALEVQAVKLGIPITEQDVRREFDEFLAWKSKDDRA